MGGWWSERVDVRVVVLLRPRVFVNELPSGQGPGQLLDGAEHVVVDSDVFDDLARVLVQLVDGVEALVGAVVPNPGQRVFGGRVNCGGSLAPGVGFPLALLLRQFNKDARVLVQLLPPSVVLAVDRIYFLRRAKRGIFFEMVQGGGSEPNKLSGLVNS